MSYTLTDLPRPVEPAAYDRALVHMRNALSLRPSVRAIYQVGGVSTPGISDLDMVAVFEDGATCELDPLREIEGVDRYLFVHGLFGTSASLTASARPYSLLHNARLLWGEPGTLRPPGNPSPALKRQVGLEYLLRLYVALTVQRAYGVVKVRGFLLQAKAVRYDLEFLGATGGRMAELTDDLIDRRQRWFEQTPSAASFANLFDAFSDELETFLRNEPGSLFLPETGPYRLGRGIQLQAGSLGVQHRGVRLPRSLARRRPRVYHGLQRRLNRFTFQAPIETDGLPTEVAGRFETIDRIQRYNDRHLPHFGGLGLQLLTS